MAGGHPVPVVKIQHKKGGDVITINESDLDEWKKKGYKHVVVGLKEVAEPEPKPKAPEPEPVDVEEDDDEDGVDIPDAETVMKMSSSELKVAIKEYDLNVSLKGLTKLSEKRQAVINAFENEYEE